MENTVVDPMDRPIAAQDLRRRRARRLVTGAACVLLALVVVRVTLSLARPSVSVARIRTAIVDRGPIEATVSGRGRVVPLYEHVITSPIDSRVTAILELPGSDLHAGEPILELDVSTARLELDKLKDQIALKQNERERANVELERTLSDLRGRQAVQALEVETCRYRATRDRRLVELGVCSEDQARTSAADAERARIELEQLAESIANAQRVLDVQLRGLDLEVGILEKERDAAARQLELATPSADRDGVLTWVVASEGAAVRQGDEIARIADLSSFRVEATVADVHAGLLARGQPAEIVAGDTHLRGAITSIRPTVENGSVTFEVALDEPGNAMLRHNMRVDVYVVTDRKENAVCVQRGAYITLGGGDAVFVVRGDVAERTPVTFGITNYETSEILAGPVPGDEVIISDMKRFTRVKEVKLR
jgi:HlyD family secretion protein